MNRATMANGAAGARGAGLGVASQGLNVAAWVLAALAATDGGMTGLVAASLGAAGLILSAVAFFRMRPALGNFGFAAGWAQAGAIGFALLVFLAVPGDREWGKLAAMIFAVGALGLGTAGAHLVAGLGLRAAGLPGLGWAVVGSQVVVLVACLAAAMTRAEALIVAFSAAGLGHLLACVGFGLLGRRGP